MTLEEFGGALTWTSGVALIERLDADLVQRAETALAARLGDGAAEAFERLDLPSRDRVLRAPEVTRRLLFASPVPGDAEGFLEGAIAVEAALAGVNAPPAAPSWSALGDVLLGPVGTTIRWPQLDGFTMVLDFGSPRAQAIDLSGRYETTDRVRPQFTAAQLRLVHRRLARTVGALGDLSPTVRSFVDRATCVLALQIDPDGLNHVASGTNGNYIGRSFIANPHLPSATLDALAEAVVHEAIHGLIYRDSLSRPWVRGAAAEEVPRVRSPWTGRALPVRAFLEAACVWFGLAHLWAIAHRAGTFERTAARDRLVRSIGGFGQGSLLDCVRPWRADIRPDVAQIVDGLQRQIVDALADAA